MQSFLFFTSLFVVKMNPFILFDIQIVNLNFGGDYFYVTNSDPQKLLAIHMFERLFMLTSTKSPLHSCFLFPSLKDIFFGL